MHIFSINRDNVVHCQGQQLAGKECNTRHRHHYFLPQVARISRLMHFETQHHHKHMTMLRLSIMFWIPLKENTYLYHSEYATIFSCKPSKGILRWITSLTQIQQAKIYRKNLSQVLTPGHPSPSVPSGFS